VVASHACAPEAHRAPDVSIPFIAGQWSLPTTSHSRRTCRSGSQSPSLRGSGRFAEPWLPHAQQVVAGFNPLHCGAVVASRGVGMGRRRRRVVSIPFIAGQWSLLPPAVWRGERGLRVSIPFIAGQWSLRGVSVTTHGGVSGFQSPSLRGSGRFDVTPRDTLWAAIAFQSPSLRGSGRFPPPNVILSTLLGKFQSPSLRGSGRFRLARAAAESLEAFQSPSLRGSGRFSWWLTKDVLRGRWFQSPSLRGSGRFKTTRPSRAPG